MHQLAIDIAELGLGCCVKLDTRYKTVFDCIEDCSLRDMAQYAMELVDGPPLEGFRQ